MAHPSFSYFSYQRAGKHENQRYRILAVPAATFPPPPPRAPIQTKT